LPVAVLDADRNIDMVNHAWVMLFSDGETSGAKHFDAAGTDISMQWLSEEIDALRESLENERAVEKSVTTALGLRHMSVRLKRMFDRSQKFGGCIILLNDITQQKQAESALEETSIWLTEMCNSLEEVVFLTTPKGKIVDVNAAAERVFGFVPNEMKNRSTEILHVDRDHFQKFKKHIRESLSKGEKAIFEYPAKRKNGEVFPAILNVTLLSKPDNAPLGIVCVLRDLSELKNAEKVIRKNERLQGALELAGAVCHDLNQPLMAIGGYAELALMECPENAPYMGNLKNIISQVAKVGTITKKLMNVTRYETKPYLGQQIIDIDKASSNS
jgi:PAS domain S-box-containing protein